MNQQLHRWWDGEAKREGSGVCSPWQASSVPERFPPLILLGWATWLPHKCRSLRMLLLSWTAVSYYQDTGKPRASGRNYFQAGASHLKQSIQILKALFFHSALGATLTLWCCPNSQEVFMTVYWWGSRRKRRQAGALFLKAQFTLRCI